MPEVVLDAPRGGAPTPPRIRPRGLGRGRGLHVLRPPREAAASIGKEDILEPLNRQACTSPRRWPARATPCSPAISATRTSTSGRRSRCRFVRTSSRSRWAGRSMPGSTSSSAKPSPGSPRRELALDEIKARAARGHHARRAPAWPDSARAAGRRRVPAPRGRGRGRRRAELLARARDHAAAARAIRRRSKGHIAALPVPYRTTAESRPSSPSGPGLRFLPGGRPFPTALDPFICNRYEIAEFARRRTILACATWASAAAPGPTTSGPCRGARPHAAGEPILGGHGQATRTSGPTPSSRRPTASTRRGSRLRADRGQAAGAARAGDGQRSGRGVASLRRYSISEPRRSNSTLATWPAGSNQNSRSSSPTMR